MLSAVGTLFDIVMALIRPGERAEVGMVVAWGGAALCAFLMGFHRISVVLVLMFVACVVAGLLQTHAVLSDRDEKRRVRKNIAKARAKRDAARTRDRR